MPSTSIHICCVAGKSVTSGQFDGLGELGSKRSAEKLALRWCDAQKCNVVVRLLFRIREAFLHHGLLDVAVVIRPHEA